MDRIELSVIDENTRIVVPQPLRLDKETSQQPFCVVTEEPDHPGQCHVFEGKLFVKGWTSLPAEIKEQLQENARVILEGFGEDVGRYEKEIQDQLSSLRFCQVGFGKVDANHHLCHLPLDATVANVRRSNIQRIVISTIHPWELGLLLGAGRLVKNSDSE